MECISNKDTIFYIIKKLNVIYKSSKSKYLIEWYGHAACRI